MIEQLLKKRRNCKLYLDKVPSKELIEKILSKTYECIASKQGLVPYKVHVLGPEKIETKKLMLKLSANPGLDNGYSETKGGIDNMDLLAPYVLIFTTRLAKPNIATQKKIDDYGAYYPQCDPKYYRDFYDEANIEIGMFSKVVTMFAMENNLDVSYVLCLSNKMYEKENDNPLFSFMKGEDQLLFVMTLGYMDKDNDRNNIIISIEDNKPQQKEIINWV